MLRPRKRVLEDSAIVPADNLMTPPKAFTHVLRKTQPYYYEPGSDAPDGSLAAGTCVKLLDHDGEIGWVVTAGGLRVATEVEGLRKTASAGRPKTARASKPK